MLPPLNVHRDLIYSEDRSNYFFGTLFEEQIWQYYSSIHISLWYAINSNKMYELEKLFFKFRLP